MKKPGYYFTKTTESLTLVSRIVPNTVYVIASLAYFCTR